MFLENVRFSRTCRRVKGKKDNINIYITLQKSLECTYSKMESISPISASEPGAETRPTGGSRCFVVQGRPCALGYTTASVLSRETHKSASREWFKEQHVVNFVSFGGSALNPGCYSFQQHSKRSLSSFIMQAEKEQEVAVVTISFCPLIQRLKHFSGQGSHKTVPGWLSYWWGWALLCLLGHTHKAFKSQCVKKDSDALIRCMGSSCGKTETGT